MPKISDEKVNDMRVMQRRLSLLGMGIVMVVAVVWGMVSCYHLLWQHTVTIPWRMQPAQSILTGFYPRQTDTIGVYHWSRPIANIQLPVLTADPIQIIRIEVADSGRVVPVTVQSGVVQMTTTLEQRTRYIALLLPVHHPAIPATIQLKVPAWQGDADPRQLGLRIRTVQFVTPVTAMPPMPWVGMVVLVAVALALMCGVLGVPLWGSLVGGGLGSLCLFGFGVYWNPLLIGDWLQAWSLVLPIVPLFLGFLRWRSPHIPRMVLYGLAFWLLVRLVLVVYPMFDGHDFLIHAKRLGEFHRLQSLTLLDHPFEFSGRPALILPLFYWLSDALARVVGLDLAMHVVIVCAESLLAVVVWLILRQCQVPARTAIIATLLTLAMPIATAILWWSFMPQVLAHLLAFVVIYATLRRDRWGAVLAGVAMAGVVWTHIGEVLIIAVWYIGLRVSEPDRWSSSWWWRWLPVVVLPFSAVSLYVNYVYTLLDSAPTVARAVPSRFANMLAQIKEGLAVGFAPLAWWLTPLLMLVAWRRLPQLAPAWTVTVVFWLSVELITGYQVRYGYLAVPLIAIGLAYCLTPLTRYGRAGWVFVLTIVLFVTWVSLALWVDATLLGVRPRVDGLSH